MNLYEEDPNSWRWRHRSPQAGDTESSKDGGDSGCDNCVGQGLDCHRGDNPEGENHQISQNKSEIQFKPKLYKATFLGLVIIHVGLFYGLYLLVFFASFKTAFWLLISIYLSGFGITAGAHRLWSHRAYKASRPLEVLLLILFTVSGQRDVHSWVLDHRVHHKYSDTEADPHNAKRGFFFSHVGWLFLSPHPLVVEKRAQIDMSDLESDPLIMWHKKYYLPLFLLLGFFIPTAIPVYFWKESLWVSFWVSFVMRYTISLNSAFFVNSAAHMWGMRPYDKSIYPADNISVSIAALGEGWHNYHHVFPYDYKTGELGDYTLNPTTGFIDFFALIGWVHDRKTVSMDMVRRRKERTGDGTSIWGWGDPDIAKEDYEDLKSQERAAN